MQFEVLLTIFATAKLANWTLTAYRELDKPLTQAYRQILALPPNFFTTLLYIPMRPSPTVRSFPDTKMAKTLEL
jgi:hypothetical protein